ncbi:hypothetical protein GCM10007382_03750 [Salinibacterium xinjiangense]|nr:hypothetical protein GCM10007382_03750 [Salinibacterium xinjiangense]
MVSGAILGAFERSSTDERGRFRVDQLLVQRLGRDPDPVGDIGEFELAKKVKPGSGLEPSCVCVFL